MKILMHKNFPRSFKFLSLAASGILLNGCFAPFNFFPFAFISFSVLFYFVDNSNSFKEAFFLAYIFGYAHSLIAFSWIGSSLLIDNDFIWLWPICIFGIPIVFALYYSIVGIIYKLLLFKNLIAKIFWFCTSWSIIEFVRTYSVVGLPWNLICYIWSNHEKFLQISYFVPPILLSWVSVFIFTMPIAFATLSEAVSWRFFGLATSSFLLIFGFFFGSFRLNRPIEFHEEYKFSVLQNSLGEKETWSSRNLKKTIMYENISFMKSAGKDFATHFFLGESGIPIKIYEDLGKVNFFDLSLPNSILLSGTIKISSNGKNYNSTVGIDLDGGKLIYFYDKNILVPFGEYIPFRLFLSTLFPRTIGNIGDFSKGKSSPVVEIKNTPKFINLICYESIFLSLLKKKFALKSVNFEWVLINTNDGWFEQSFGPYQHLSIAKFIAARLGVPVVRVANSGVSALIDPYGRIIMSMKFKKKGVLNFKLPKMINS